MARTKIDRAAQQQAVMRRRVMAARIRAGRLAEEMAAVAQELQGTRDFVPAYERYLEAHKTEAWLAGVLDGMAHK